jgi:hypothetical protein
VEVDEWGDESERVSNDICTTNTPRTQAPPNHPPAHILHHPHSRFDHTVPEIAALFPTPAAYAAFISPWADAVRERFPAATLLLCGSYPGDPDWTAGVLASPVGRDARNDVTLHVYTALPQVSE